MKLTFLFLIFTPVLACRWDHDTIEMERQRFPTVLELITGKFLRHSAEFYQWRIKDRTEKLTKDPEKLEYYDDLAVAYDSVDNRAKAIEIMLEKEKKKPGLYETYANLGTFYIHDGKLEQGVEFIKKAIQINPDAHFGREVYQQLLVEYIIDNHVSGGKLNLPLTSVQEDRNFASFALKKRGYEKPNSAEAKDELAKQLKGLLGIMKFGNYRYPILLEALGNSLLANSGYEQRIVASAYLKASYEVKDTISQLAYREMAKQVLTMQKDETLESVETELKNQIQEADAWYATVRADELKWIEEGGDVEAKFSAKYYTEPELSHSRIKSWIKGVWSNPNGLVFLVSAFFIGLYIVLKIYSRRRTRVA